MDPQHLHYTAKHRTLSITGGVGIQRTQTNDTPVGFGVRLGSLMTGQRTRMDPLFVLDALASVLTSTGDKRARARRRLRSVLRRGLGG